MSRDVFAMLISSEPTIRVLVDDEMGRNTIAYRGGKLREAGTWTLRFVHDWSKHEARPRETE
ncbi:MAG: hypothetical protein Q9175_004416 [Cornicularia normoerica]